MIEIFDFFRVSFENGQPIPILVLLLDLISYMRSVSDSVCLSMYVCVCVSVCMSVCFKCFLSDNRSELLMRSLCCLRFFRYILCNFSNSCRQRVIFFHQMHSSYIFFPKISFLLDPICYIGRLLDSVSVCVCVCLCVSFQRLLSANRSPMFRKLSS